VVLVPRAPVVDDQLLSTRAGHGGASVGMGSGGNSRTPTRKRRSR
jgi:hypothetical protein